MQTALSTEDCGAPDGVSCWHALMAGGDVTFRRRKQRPFYFFKRSFTTPPPIGERNIVMSVSVCACVCLSASISTELHVRSSPIFCACYLWPWRGCLWRRNDTLCTSGFMDDVILAHKPRLLDVTAQLKRSAHAALGLANSVHSNTSCRPTDVRDYTFRVLKITSQMATLHRGWSLRSESLLFMQQIFSNNEFIMSF